MRLGTLPDKCVKRATTRGGSGLARLWQDRPHQDKSSWPPQHLAGRTQGPVTPPSRFAAKRPQRSGGTNDQRRGMTRTGDRTLDFLLHAGHRNQQRKQTLSGRPFQSFRPKPRLSGPPRSDSWFRRPPALSCASASDPPPHEARKIPLHSPFDPSSVRAVHHLPPARWRMCAHPPPFFSSASPPRASPRCLESCTG